MVTNAYGPFEETEKPTFVQELRDLSAHINHPWMPLGDFNLIRWLIDRSRDMRGLSLMMLFNDLIRQLALIDIPLTNRTYNWSNKQRKLRFSRLESLGYYLLVITLSSLGSTCQRNDSFRSFPLLLQCKGLPPRPRFPKFELFRLRYPRTRDVVQRIWASVKDQATNQLHSFQLKLDIIQKELAEWHRTCFTSMETQLDFSKKTILFFDRIEEKRKLEDYEFHPRIKVREKAYELACSTEQ